MRASSARALGQAERIPRPGTNRGVDQRDRAPRRSGAQWLDHLGHPHRAATGIASGVLARIAGGYPNAHDKSMALGSARSQEPARSPSVRWRPDPQVRARPSRHQGPSGSRRGRDARTPAQIARRPIGRPRGGHVVPEPARGSPSRRLSPRAGRPTGPEPMSKAMGRKAMLCHDTIDQPWPTWYRSHRARSGIAPGTATNGAGRRCGPCVRTARWTSRHAVEACRWARRCRQPRRRMANRARSELCHARSIGASRAATSSRPPPIPMVPSDMTAEIMPKTLLSGSSR